MSLLNKLFGRKHVPQPTQSGEHAVIVNFGYGSTDLDPIFALGERLEQAILAASAGEFDGNEVAADGSDGSLYMYGPDADRLFAVIRPILESADFVQATRVKLRYGPAGSSAKEQTIVLGA